MPSIEQIPAYMVWPLRHQVMYPEKNFEDVKLPDDANGIHFGLFDHNKLVSVVSLFQTGHTIQFRKFATLSEFQGMGYGTLLLEYLMEFSRQEGCSKIWCNARKNALRFYQKFGFCETPETFFKDGYDFVVIERYL